MSHTLAAAFARQRAGKLCKFCKERIPFDSFQRHVQLYCNAGASHDQCINIDDDDDLAPVSPKPVCSTDENENEAVEDETESEFRPYYQRIFMEIVESIYNENEHFWNEEQKQFINSFLKLNDLSQKLYIRLFLRKIKWIPIENLNYAEIKEEEKEKNLDLLAENGFLESTSKSQLSLQELFSLLHLNHLRAVCKYFKLDFNGKKEELISLLFAHSKQKTLFGQTLESKVAQRCQKELGLCFRVKIKVHHIFQSILHLYAPSFMYSANLLDNPSVNLAQKLLFNLQQSSTGELQYPCASSQILNRPQLYKDSTQILNYIDAQDLESRVATYIFKKEWQQIIDISLEARNLFSQIPKNELDFARTLPEFLRRYTYPWVLTRLCFHGVEAMQRLKLYKDTNEILEWLLRIENGFCLDNRGIWWQRLALNLHMHMKLNQEGLDAVLSGLSDENVRLKDKLPLFERLQRFQKSKTKLKMPKKLPKEPSLRELDEVTINGTLLHKNLGDGSINVFVSSTDKSSVCSVETVALQYYVKEMGFTEGIHGEGAMWHTVFGLLCWPIIFELSLPHVWLCHIQSEPLDLHSKHFYEARKSSFDEMFDWISNASEEEICERLEKSWDENCGTNCYFVNWDKFENVTQIQRFACCVGAERLAKFFRYFCVDFRHKRSGFPDLTVWNEKEKRVMVSEVKGPGDRLSSKQRLWLDFFQSIGIGAQLCHVVGAKRKRLHE